MKFVKKEELGKLKTVDYPALFHSQKILLSVPPSLKNDHLLDLLILTFENIY